MKIVTYNVNGLRPRISQFGSLRKLLDSLDADIICFQETKLSRNELRDDLVRAEGYESFFSCTRTSDKGRTGYSGVATFCRVKSAFSSSEVALPFTAEEGFTGVLENYQGYGSRKNEYQSMPKGLEDFSTEELQKIDGEGRCVITDHGHFVLFNVYGPRAQSDDKERIQFKHKFFNLLQRRWEYFLGQGRRIFIVGDLNIAPAAIDRCDAEPNFEKNEFRTWFRSLLVRNGGSLFDVFREKHPARRAYTCWATNSGAEEFDFGSRIDHILIAGPCLHEEEKQRHDLIICHVKECDILDQFKRWKPGNTPRWKAGRNIKLEGSDHVPVYMSLVDIPNVQEHSTPSLSTRYCPQVRGYQQKLGANLSVSMFARRQPAEGNNLSGGCSSISNNSIVVEGCSQLKKRPLSACSSSLSDLLHEAEPCTPDDCSEGFIKQSSLHEAGPCTPHDCSEGFIKQSSNASQCILTNHTKSSPSMLCKKKSKKSQGSQLSLKSFFQKTAGITGNSNSFCTDKKIDEEDISSPCVESIENPGECSKTESEKERDSSPVQKDDASQSSEKEKNNLAFAEWQRIQKLMQSSIPVCKGHKEPCVPRVVKKPGPTFGRQFYVCARAEGPASNSEANCGFFKWATSSKQKG